MHRMSTSLSTFVVAAFLGVFVRGDDPRFTHDLLAVGDLSAFGLHQCEAVFEG